MHLVIHMILTEVYGRIFNIDRQWKTSDVEKVLKTGILCIGIY